VIGEDVVAVEALDDREAILERRERRHIVAERQRGQATIDDALDADVILPLDLLRLHGPALQPLALQHEDEPQWRRSRARGLRFQLAQDRSQQHSSCSQCQAAQERSSRRVHRYLHTVTVPNYWEELRETETHRT
jgi:hypothetical protein